jgi:predicted transcriptional regulator
MCIATGLEASVRFAIALGRDYRRVHEDVAALVEAGLLDRDESGLHADYEAVKIQTRVAL